MPDYELHADYDRNGALTASPVEHRFRMRGAIVLPNLDADGRKLPARVERTGMVTLDCDRPIRTAGDNELLPLRVSVVKATAPAGSRVFLQITGNLAAKARLFDRGGHPIAADVKNGFPLDLTVPRVDVQLELQTLAGTPLRSPGRFFGMGEEDLALHLVAVDPSGVTLSLDQGAVRVAPFLIPSNNEPAVRLYICDQVDNEIGRASCRERV